MARLNEPPVAPGASAETVEVVKRRYLRQNRELAKTNSQQSIRIRNLETEGSRLLAENLSLREQVLQLQSANEAQSSRPSFENIDAVKSRLEAKISEFGVLVAELGQLREADPGPKCKSQPAATRRGPDERQWRSGLGLQAVQDAMLPTIVEDKYFPRRTMGGDELQAILNGTDSLSPDIGPPPVSRFDFEEPISFNPSPLSDEQAEVPAENPDPALSVNLESRRKRRESGSSLDMRRVSIGEPLPDGLEERPAKSVRPGSKRKFNVQEDEDKSNTVNPPSETFTFTRRSVTGTAGDTDTNMNVQQPSPERVVLSSKPVNTDPVVSPKKQRSSAGGKPDKPDKRPASSKPTRGRLTITRNVQPELPPFQPPEPIPTAVINLESLPPKTPAVEDVFSPPSRETSTSRPQSNDTPPPGDLNSDDQTGLGARPSRRARPAVSYKEPSLHTKMRRPGKDLIDAVQPTNDRRSSVEPISVVKAETGGNDSAWKTMPSASGRRESEVEPGSPLREKLGRRELEESHMVEAVPEPLKLNSSAASSAISALISATSSAKRKPTPMSSTDTAELKNGPVAAKIHLPLANGSSSRSIKARSMKQAEKDNIAIFDFTDGLEDDAPATSQTRNDLSKAVKSTRRHSSIPTSSSTEERQPDPRPRPHGALPSLQSHSRSSSASGSTVKSSTTSNLTKSTPSASKGLPVKDKRPSSTLPSTASAIDLGLSPTEAVEGIATSTGNLRAERAASRRKSMMM